MASEKEKDLQDAIRTLENWESRDAVRTDGSVRQDRMHEERGGA